MPEARDLTKNDATPKVSSKRHSKLPNKGVKTLNTVRRQATRQCFKVSAKLHPLKVKNEAGIGKDCFLRHYRQSTKDLHKFFTDVLTTLDGVFPPATSRNHYKA